MTIAKWHNVTRRANALNGLEPQSYVLRAIDSGSISRVVCKRE